MSIQNHTGNELNLMLNREKPLAMFYDDESADSSDTIIPEKEFDVFVEKNLFKKGVKIFDLSPDPRIGQTIRLRYVLYALPEEEWRINAMFIALETMIKMGRADEGTDRIMGSLLGYDAQQIDSFIQKHNETKQAVTCCHCR